MDRYHTPTPDLRIVYTDSLHPHEEHDSQRALPLIERLKTEAYIINPPIAAPIGSSQYVILDGANRCHSFLALGFPHILIQVASYESGFVELQTWNHIVSNWEEGAFLDHLANLPEIEVIPAQSAQAIAHVITRSNQTFALCSPVNTVHERNAALRKVVNIYQQHAVLHRTTLSEPDEIWPLYEHAVAVVMFPHYRPADIIAAAKHRAFLPAGVSRHIVHGRALRVNYPMELLKDDTVCLKDKNESLRRWLQDKLAKRRVRYYAESTYQFDE
ncbi:MAG TPA: hypothetical protein VKY59_02740 [Spirillospora sp.]|nr:hypothetical protein [Spirillospora sp.]